MHRRKAEGRAPHAHMHARSHTAPSPYTVPSVSDMHVTRCERCTPPPQEFVQCARQRAHTQNVTDTERGGGRERGRRRAQEGTPNHITHKGVRRAIEIERRETGCQSQRGGGGDAARPHSKLDSCRQGQNGTHAMWGVQLYCCWKTCRLRWLAGAECDARRDALRAQRAERAHPPARSGLD